jgi:glycosyltransferase involved in cell wall biosynthesis
MPHLINPGGRIVAIDDEAQYEKLLTQGFSVPTQEQVDAFIKSRYQLVSAMVEPSDAQKSVYMVTVSQGGKDGYGIASAKIVSELQKLDTNISFFNKGQKIGFLFHAPYSIMRMENPVKIIFTMFESDKIPDEWVDYLKEADKVIVPSHWCMEVFAKSGINAQVIPLGIDESIFTPVERPLKEETHEPFYFLHYNAFNVRKGFLELLNAFKKEFDPSEPVRMIFKTSLDQIPLPLSPQQYPNIIIEKGQLEELKLVELLHKADCFVFPSRGEGFGMTPLEAMATGLPVIVPNAHGISEYFDSECMYDVKYQADTPAIYYKYKNQDVGHMITCDVDDLARQMRYVYTHQKEAREKGRKAAIHARNYTFAKTAAQLKVLFDEYKEKEVQPRKLANLLPLEEVI